MLLLLGEVMVDAGKVLELEARRPLSPLGDPKKWTARVFRRGLCGVASRLVYLAMETSYYFLRNRTLSK